MSEPAPPADESAGHQRDLNRKAVRGATVTMGAQAAKIAIQFVSVIALARLLTPREYGLVAMVVAVVGIADIFRDLGLSSAAIQARTLSRKEQHNLFWMNTALGLVLTLAIVAASPLIAAVYHQPELLHLAQVLAVMFLLNGMATQYRADLSRRMRFNRLAGADIGSSVVALGVALVAATLGAGYWALAVQRIVQVGVMLIVVGVSAAWLPGRYHRDVRMRHLLDFGWKLTGSQLIAYLGNNIDSFTLGRWHGAATLGLYNRSYQLVMTPLAQVRGPLTTVALPFFSRLQDDEERFDDYVARAQLALGYTVILGLVCAAGAATPLVDILLGRQWSEAAPIFALLCLAGAFTTLDYVAYWVFLTKGLVDHLLRYTLISTSIRIVCVLIGLNWGAIGVAAGMAAAPMLSWPLCFWWLSRRARIPVRRLLIGGIRITGVSAVVGLAAFGGSLGAQQSALSLCFAAAAAAAAFGVMLLLIPAIRREVWSVGDIVKVGLRRG